MFHLTDEQNNLESKIAKVTSDGENSYIYIATGKKGPKEAMFESRGNSDSVFPYFDKIKSQNHRLFVTGKSGSGKSWTIGKVLNQLIHTKPALTEEDIQNDRFIGVVIFSSVSEDEALDVSRRGLMPLRIDLSADSLFSLQPSDLRDCIVVFDDIEKHHDKKAKQFMVNFRANLFETGRHYNIDVISVSHLALSGSLNNTAKSEATGAFLFPQYNQPHQTEEFLKKYVGLKPDQIDRIMNLESRWVYININSPEYVVYDHGIYLLR